jgi:hypothetical protein
MPGAHIEYHIDFDEDREYESGEEISSDLRTAVITRGKNVVNNRAPASTLTSSLNWEDAKYVPINTSSPLYPFQLPGPHARVRLAYPYDAMGGDNGDSVNGRQMPAAADQTIDDHDIGTYTADTQWEIRDNHAEVTSGGGKRLAVVDFEVANVRLGADIVRESGSISYPYIQSLLTFRYTDANNYNEVAIVATTSAGPFTLAVYSTVAGSTSVKTATKALTLEDDFWAEGTAAFVEIQVIEEEVLAWVNDFSVGEWTSITNQQTATMHGIGGHMISSNAASGTAGSRLAQYDNFGGWNTMFNGRTDEVSPQIGDDPQVNVIAFDDLERLKAHPVFKSTVPDATTGRFDTIVDLILDGGGVIKEHPTPIGSPLAPVESLRVADEGYVINPTYEKVIGGDGLSALYQAQEDEVGFIWIDGRGTYRVESSDHRDAAPHDTYHATWEADSDDADKPYFARDPRPVWKDGKDVVENEVYVRYARASKATGATIWTMSVDEDPDFGHTNNFNGWMKLDMVAVDAASAISNPKLPAPGTDYSIDENADGTGVDWLTYSSHTGVNSTVRTSDYTLDDPDGRNFATDSMTVGVGSGGVNSRLVTLEDSVTGGRAVAYIMPTGALGGNPDGDGTRVQLTDWPEDFEGVGAYGTPGYIWADSNFDPDSNNVQYKVMWSGAYLVEGFEGEMAIIRFLTTNAYEDSNFLTSAILKGDQTTESNPTAGRAQDDDSIASFGRRRVDHQSKFIDEFEIAKNRAEKRVALRSEERERFTVTIKNSSQRNLMEIMYRDVSDRIRINFSDIGMTNRNYWIESYVTTISMGGKLIETTYTLSKVI